MKTILNIKITFIYLLVFLSTVLSGQISATESVELDHRAEDVELAYIQANKTFYDIVTREGHKNIGYNSTSSAYLPDNYVKRPSVMEQQPDYIVLYPPRVNNNNNINVVPKITTIFDSCQFVKLLNNNKISDSLSNQKREDELLFMLNILDYMENDLKEQENKKRSEAIGNLIWSIILLISIVILRYNHGVKQDRLVQSMIALVVVASLVMFISGLPNAIIYYFGM